MLSELYVRDFALIEEIRLSFSAHLNVLSGETGAGKSIIVDAMKLLLGERANVRDIRQGKEEAMVEGVFEIDDESSVQEQLTILGMSENTVILTRIIKANGKNICRINHRAVTLAQFRGVATRLVNIYGQHDYVALAKTENQLKLLDSLGDSTHRALMSEVQKQFVNTRKSARILKQAIDSSKKNVKTVQEAARHLKKLIPLKLTLGEEEVTSERFHTLSNVSLIREQVGNAYADLYGNEEACQAQLTRAIQALQNAAKYDDVIKEMIPDLDSALIAIQEAALTLQKYVELSDDKEEIEKLSNRLKLYEQLYQQYDCRVDELIVKMKDWQVLVDSASTSGADLEMLQKQFGKDKADFRKKADALHTSRRKLAQQFEKTLLQELKDLSMSHARFTVDFKETTATAEGYDEICFLLSANPGTDIAPLHEIASGGEMSRIMLAFKTILTNKQSMDTLIFDEIDTGIGGLTLNQVADKLARVSRQEQVICVTHAAAIAAYAETNLYIVKETDEAKTTISVHELEEEAVIQELARMLGGNESWYLEHAKQLRCRCRSN